MSFYACLAMPPFLTSRSAKEFLVSKIVEEAEREGVSLSEIERKMLYFSETAWSLPDIWEVNEEFDRTYDSAAYKRKIASLIRNLKTHLPERDPEGWKTWQRAERLLSQEDHYILLLMDVASGKFSASGSASPLIDGRRALQLLLYVVVGTAISLALLALFLRLRQ